MSQTTHPHVHQEPDRDLDHPHPETVFGFWVYIMTDCMIFASLFAVFAVQRGAYAGGPNGHALFDLKSTLLETFLLLTSSTTCGYAMVCLHHRRQNLMGLFLLLTLACGLGFVGLEISEFLKLIAEGAGPDRSAFLSAFFILVGTHGLHVTCGMIWMLVLLFDIFIRKRGLPPVIGRRLLAFSLFWHFLDIIWICLFTFVYLNGYLA
jgi:cytochrome o ubiquinol oxidase subunit 3